MKRPKLSVLHGEAQGTVHSRKERCRVLIVDDDRFNRVLLRALLEAKGYAALEATSGEEALELIAGETEIDIVLLDVNMPGIDGVTTCKMIRGELGLMHLPVVMVTGSDTKAFRIAGKKAGVDDFLSKPVDPAELFARLDTLIRAKRDLDLMARREERLGRDLDAMRAQLVRAERLATVGTLAGGVGHELNNLATIATVAVEMVAEAAREGRPPDAEDVEQLQWVKERLILHGRELLAVVRPRDDEPDHCDLCDAHESVVKLLALAGTTKKVRLESQLPHHGLEVQLAQTRVEQVLFNVITNAVHAIGAASRHDGVVVVSVQRRGDRAHGEVRDNGCGMSPEAMANAFEPYYTTKPPTQGTGLGLPVVRQIIAAAGGNCSLGCDANGTVFCFDLPLARNSGVHGPYQPQSD